jgi:hypothetical protein
VRAQPLDARFVRSGLGGNGWLPGVASVAAGVVLMSERRPSSAAWRTRWVIFCRAWAAIWFVTGIFFLPFWVMVPVSLLLLLLPVGKSR